MKPQPGVPPWVYDNSQPYWVSVGVAARFYFMKSKQTVRDYIKANTIPGFFDGTRWHVRLPIILSAKPPKRQKRTPA